MMDSVREALEERDLLLLVADASEPFSEADEGALRLAAGRQTPMFLVLNKIDRLRDKAALLPLIERYRAAAEFAEAIPVSALTGEGLDVLVREMLERLPEGPRYFPPEHLTDQPERLLAAELIRERVLEETRQEVPHAVAALVEQWEDKGRRTRIAATIVVEREGQKRILIGAGGAMLKKIGTAARLEMQRLFGREIFLELFVKVRPGWRNDPAFLDELDWRNIAGR
jgi:GTP-binding protein Era